MKIRYPITISVILLIAIIVIGAGYAPIPWHLQNEITEVLGILWLISIGLSCYLILRNIFQAIIEAVKKTKKP